MLSPEYFYGKSDKLIEMYQELEDWIIQDIANRLIKSGELSGTADREIWKLQQMGLHNDEIIKKVANMSKKSQSEVRRILKDSVMTSFSDDVDVLKKYGTVTPPNVNEAALMAVNAEMLKTLGELDNLTRTTMQQTQRDLLDLLNEVDYRVASGMQSYSSAICEVLDRYARAGVIIDYPTGARRTLEAAVRCCVVTSMNQTAAQVTNQYIVEGGIEYVLVSAHMGARHSEKKPTGVESHDFWQGKVYKIVGSDEDAPNLLESTGYTIDPKSGKGKVVDPLGLHGYNCRHSHKPWDKSLRNPYMDEKGNPKIDIHESQELYNMQQVQRRKERAIRQTKRELLAKQKELDGIAETGVKDVLQPEYDALAYKLREQNKEYIAYCDQKGLQTQEERVKVAGFKKKQAAVANGRATVFQNTNISHKSGAVYNYKNDPDGRKRQKIADDLYKETQNRDSQYEIRAVAKNSGLSESNVKKIYEHIFINEHLFKDGTIHKFEPDYEMAQSWQRLRNNIDIQPHDITLLKHELAEYSIMEESIDIEYESVHNEIVKKYNYQKELIQYLKEKGRE